MLDQELVDALVGGEDAGGGWGGGLRLLRRHRIEILN
jgi:hypothetical protein